MSPIRLVTSNALPGPRILRQSRDGLPEDAEALLLEDDTFGVLAADPHWRDPQQHPIRIMEGLYRQQARQTGDLIIGTGRPPRWLAVIHDLDSEPSCRPEWIRGAIQQALRQCMQQSVEHLAMERLGTVHGPLTEDDFEELLGDCLHQDPPARLRTVTLLPRSWRQCSRG